MHDIAIIGGGAAGMMAAVSAAQNGKNVIISITKNLLNKMFRGFFLVAGEGFEPTTSGL